MEKVPVEPSILKWAVRRSGLTVNKIQRKFPRYNLWEAGIDAPTFRQLEAFADATYTPLGFMFLKQPPKEELPVPYYRTIPSYGNAEISVNLMDTIHTVQSRQIWMREYLSDIGAKKLEFINSVNINESTDEIAAKMRNVFGLERKWAGKYKTWTDALQVLRQKMEDQGIVVVVNGVVGNNTNRKLDPREFRGFVLVDDFAPLVFINGADGKAAQMFTLAHELAHLFLGHSAIFDLNGIMPSEEIIEKKCDQIAAEFLAPAKEFKELWRQCRSDTNSFQCIARQFKVSEIVVARRALDLGIISKNTFFKFYNDYQEKEYANSRHGTSGGNFYSNLNFRIGKRFAASVFSATLAGKLLYTDAYRLTGLKGKTFTNFAARLGYEV